MGKKPDDARQTANADRAKGRVTAAQVAEYLRQHPEFLVRHPDLLDIQIVPGRRKAEGVVDLQQFMVERLRRDVQRLKADQDDLLTNSRDNLSTQDRIHKAALALLGADSIGHFVEIIASDLPMLLDVDAVALCLETTDAAAAKMPVDGLQLLPMGAVDRLLGAGRAALLRDDTVGDPTIFEASAGLVRSDALIRLKIGDSLPPGMIAFGTRHPGYFDPGQGTDLLHFLARIIEHCIRAWLELPRRSA
ncbi:MAG TPA: DUF484 family protein [Candidatus Acidoferrum sp.]|nr:DUF484 family protein [Candidatus Acidoferrum sp.]